MDTSPRVLSCCCQNLSLHHWEPNKHLASRPSHQPFPVLSPSQLPSNPAWCLGSVVCLFLHTLRTHEPVRDLVRTALPTHPPSFQKSIVLLSWSGSESYPGCPVLVPQPPAVQALPGCPTSASSSSCDYRAQDFMQREPASHLWGVS